MSETEKPIKKEDRGVGRAWPLFVGLPFLVALAVAAVLLSGERPPPTTQEQRPQPAQEEQPTGNGPEEAAQNGAKLGHPTLGDADAPVVMVEYGDFRCPFCGEFARETEPKLVDKYVESGTLRLEWRDFPYLGRESVRAALAARVSSGNTTTCSTRINPAASPTRGSSSWRARRTSTSRSSRPTSARAGTRRPSRETFGRGSGSGSRARPRFL